MAVGANSYGTVAKVEAMVGDLVASRTFAVSTTPTLAQVESFIDERASELNVALAYSGYTVPVDSDNDPTTHEWLAYINSVGASLSVLSALPAMSWAEPGEEIPSQGRRQYYENIWRSAIKRIESQRLSASGSGHRSNELKAGSAQDSSGNTKNPIFTRSLTDFPGSRTLVDS